MWQRNPDCGNASKDLVKTPARSKDTGKALTCLIARTQRASVPSRVCIETTITPTEHRG